MVIGNSIWCLRRPVVTPRVVRTIRLLGLVLLLCVLVRTAWADVTCEASVNRTSVPSGGEVVLTVLARGDVSWNPEFKLPELADVRVYSGGTNQSMSMINGRTETSVSRTYFLKVNGTEDFTIGPITISGGDMSCATDPIAIKVTAAAASSQQIPPAYTGNRTQNVNPPVATGSVAGGKPGDEVFVTLEADHTEAWVGQQIVLTFRYWRRVQPWSNPNYSPPRTEGFWRENLGSEKNTRKVLLGRAYNVTEIRYAIFPTRIGGLVVEPAELSFPRGAFDSFFQTRRNRRQPSMLRTGPISIHVKELPKPKPAGFSGIVASHLKLISQVDRDSVPRGEALGLKVLLDADGFLKGFSDLKIPHPAAARLHDAGESFRTGAEANRLVGHIKVEKVIVPEKDGDLHLPPVELVWFDTTIGQYRTAQTAAWDVAVTPSDLPVAGADDSGFLRNELSRLGDDLAFIHPVPAALARRLDPLTGSGFWWALLVAPLALLGGFRLLLNRWDAERRDPAGRRRRGALAAALTGLRVDQETLVAAVARAVCGYVADCTDQPLPSVGPNEVAAYCEQQGLMEVGQQLAEILAACDVARYGQSSGEASEQLVADVTELLAKLDRQGRSGRGSGASRVQAVGGAALIIVCLGGGMLRGPSPLLAAEVPAARPGADPVRLLAEGNQAYTEGRLPDAVDKYEAARGLGANDAVLYFNLGNTYARSGHLGQAVVSYLRAQRLAPRDGDNKANLAWVRRHIRDLELGENSLPLFVAQLVGAVGLLTLDQWGLTLILLVWILAVLLGWGWYREVYGPWLRRLLLGGGALLLVVAVITTSRWYSEEVRNSAVITAPTVVVRSGPSDDFSALFEVHDGLTLNIDEYRDQWVRVSLGGDWAGWVPVASVEPVRQAISTQGR